MCVRCDSPLSCDCPVLQELFPSEKSPQVLDLVDAMEVGSFLFPLVSSIALFCAGRLHTGATQEGTGRGILAMRGELALLVVV